MQRGAAAKGLLFHPLIIPGPPLYPVLAISFCPPVPSSFMHCPAACVRLQ